MESGTSTNDPGPDGPAGAAPEHGLADRNGPAGGGTPPPADTPPADTPSADTPPAGTSEAPRGADAFFDSIARTGLARTDDRWVAGVAGGVARRLGVDPLLVRGVWFVACLVAGAGLVLYAIAWVLLPDDREGTSLVQDAAGGRFRAAIVGAILAFVIGVNWHVGWWGWWGGAGWIAGTFWLCLLAGAAVLVAAMVNSSRSRPAPPRAAAPPAAYAAPGSAEAPAPVPTTAATAAATAAYGAAMAPTTPASTAPAPAGAGRTGATGYPGGPVDPGGFVATKPAPAPRPARTRRRGGVQGIVLGLVLVTGAVVLATSRAGDVSSPWLVWGGASMVVIGLGIVAAGALDRRHGWLTAIAIVLGLGLLPAAPLAASGAFDGYAAAIAPQDPVVVREVSTAEAGFTYSVGDLTLDLSNVPLPTAGSNPVTVPVRVGAGQTRIDVPKGAEVEARVELWAGDVEWDVDGSDVTRHGVRSGRETFQTSGVAAGQTPQIVLDVQAGAGQITIQEK